MGLREKLIGMEDKLLQCALGVHEVDLDNPCKECYVIGSGLLPFYHCINCNLITFRPLKSWLANGVNVGHNDEIPTSRTWKPVKVIPIQKQ